MRPDFSVEKKQLTAAQAGTAMHLVMEKLDFRQALSLGKGYIRQVAEELLRISGCLTKMEAVDIDNIRPTPFSRQDVGSGHGGSHVQGTGNSYPAEDKGEVIVQGM